VIVDLATQSDANPERRADIVIVGAGIAGLFLASSLRAKNIRVVVLESGSAEQKFEVHPLNRVVQLGDEYSGATKGRFRCVGGTSTRWGGALIPFSASDLHARPYLGLAGFPVGIDAVESYLPQVEKLFGVDDGSYDEEFVRKNGIKHVPIGDPDFRTRFAKWPPFRNRNVALLFRSTIASDPSVQIWINSTVTSFAVSPESGRITSVTGSCDGDRSITIQSSFVVICAGAIETTRLLLLLNRQYGGKIFQGCDALGRFFHDHISIAAAEIRAKQVFALNRMAGFRFLGAAMRSLRFELSPAAQVRERVGSAFGHISFKTDNLTGFDLLRQFLRSKQRNEPFRQGIAWEMLRELPFLSRLAFWRLAYGQLLWPVPATYELHVVAEQLPRATNRITLSSEVDCFGLPLAAIDWRIEPEDLKTFGVFGRCFERFWKENRLSDVGDLEWTDPSSRILSTHMPTTDVFHPGGSTRMGTDRVNAIVDSNLRSFHLRNLWVSSTSVFPSGGGENPTLMLILFTMRLADHLRGRLVDQAS